MSSFTEFDNQLLCRLTEHLDKNGYESQPGRKDGIKKYEVADKCEIPRQTFYDFSSGIRPLNGDNVRRLMDYLNLTVNLEEK